MRIEPLRDKAQGGRGRISQAVQLPAPTKGWYIGANMAEAPPGTAYLLENVFARPDYVRVRRGCQEYATGMGAYSVSTLMPWNNGTTSKFFAVCNNKIYDISNAGAIGAAAYTGLSNSFLQYTQFQGIGGSYLVAVNGADAPITYNGSTWGASGITTTATNPFSNISIFKNRMYFVENNSLNIWYLPVNAISGATTVFPMQGVFKYGGYIMATASWAIDSTSGIYEGFIVISSEGEVIMYNGSDPSTWALTGSYKVSKPLGKNCFSKAGGDLMVMTQDGIVPMSQVQQIDQVSLQNVALTQPIQPAWSDAVNLRSGLIGWSLTNWPTEGMAIVNLPKTDVTDKVQFIVNARTGAWSKYTGWDSNCYAIFKDALYFGSSDGRVMQGEVGSADDGANYTAIIFYSFSSLDGNVTHKQMKMIHPYQLNNILANFTVTVNQDFDTNLPNAPTSVVPNSYGAKWDIATWDGTGSVWSGALIAQNYWQGASGFGTVFAPVLQMTLSSASSFADIRLFRTDILYEDAEVIA